MEKPLVDHAGSRLKLHFWHFYGVLASVNTLPRRNDCSELQQSHRVPQGGTFPHVSNIHRMSTRCLKHWNASDGHFEASEIGALHIKLLLQLQLVSWQLRVAWGNGKSCWNWFLTPLTIWNTDNDAASIHPSPQNQIFKFKHLGTELGIVTQTFRPCGISSLISTWGANFDADEEGRVNRVILGLLCISWPL